MLNKKKSFIDKIPIRLLQSFLIKVKIEITMNWRYYHVIQEKS